MDELPLAIRFAWAMLACVLMVFGPFILTAIIAQFFGA